MPHNRKIIALVIFGILIAVLALFLPEITTGQLTYINASTIEIVGAASYSGCTIENISEINNGNCSIVEGSSPFTVTVNFTNITNFSHTDLKMLYFSTVGASTHMNDVEIWCHTENAYVDLEEFTNEIEWWYYPKNFPDSMHFIDAQGNVSFRLNHPQNGNTNHRLILDTIRLIQKPTFEQNIVYLNQTIGGAGTGSQNLSQVLQQGNSAGSYNIDMNERNIQNLNSITETSGFNQVYTSYDATTPTIRSRVYDGTISNYIEQFLTYTAFSKSITVDGNITMNGNLTGCLNCDTNLATKVNKTGDNITGIIDINDSYGYTGAQRMILKVGRNTTLTKFSVAQNDLNGAINYRINVNDDNTQQDVNGSGIALAFQPLQNRIALVMCHPGTTTCTNIYDMYLNTTVLGGKPFGEINFGSSTNSSLFPTRLYNLSGAAGLVYVDDNGILKKVSAPTGSGNVYTCWNLSTKQPFYGTPGC